jgi:hypothetical protein
MRLIDYLHRINVNIMTKARGDKTFGLLWYSCGAFHNIETLLIASSSLAFSFSVTWKYICFVMADEE